MVRKLIAKWKPISRGGDRQDHASILLPFFIISIGLGVLAWRSYQLSVKMERGANTVAVQYAGYAADITARRVDAAARTQLSQAADEWQQLERHVTTPSFSTLQDWINHNGWVVSAIYVPDSDPTSSIYVSEIPTKASQKDIHLTRDFFTSTGTVRYTFDPARLLASVHAAIHEQPPIRDTTSDMLAVQQQAHVELVPYAKGAGLVRLRDGFAFVAPLAAPLQNYAIRSTVNAAYAGSGWGNQRLISSLLSLVALLLTALGGYLAYRGLKKEAETTKLRGALIANVSHELRTPLSMIRLGAETLKRATKLKDHERKEIEEQILREVLHLSHLVENVLDVARIQHRNTSTLAFTRVFPRELVTSLVTTYESWIQSKGFTVSLQIDESIEEQMWDREAVSRALLNLIDNAIKYSADDKALELALRQTPEDIIVEVRDHGIGIAARDLERIFDPYFRAQFSDTQTRRGAGLGLTLVQQIAASHGGRVEVESEPGAGSTFRMFFPRSTSTEPRVVTRFVHAPSAF